MFARLGMSGGLHAVGQIRFEVSVELGYGNNGFTASEDAPDPSPIC